MGGGGGGGGGGIFGGWMGCCDWMRPWDTAGWDWWPSRLICATLLPPTAPPPPPLLSPPTPTFLLMRPDAVRKLCGSPLSCIDSGMEMIFHPVSWLKNNPKTIPKIGNPIISPKKSRKDPKNIPKIIPTTNRFRILTAGSQKIPKIPKMTPNNLIE